MTITLDIRPETKEELARQPPRTIGVGAYAQCLLERRPMLRQTSPYSGSGEDMVELFAPLRGLNLDLTDRTQAGE